MTGRPTGLLGGLDGPLRALLRALVRVPALVLDWVPVPRRLALRCREHPGEHGQRAAEQAAPRLGVCQPLGQRIKAGGVHEPSS
jgi:hypothetical protein